MNNNLYSKAGVAEFYCPVLYKLMDHKHHTEMTFDEKSKYDGDGHSSYTFVWDIGAYHITHEKNGGIPKCKNCGKELIFITGDNPY